MRLLLTLTALLSTFTLALEPVNTIAGPFSIIRISDGDTVEVASLGRVRLIGIDTPEKFEGDKLDRDAERLGIPKEDIQAMGRSASAYTEGILEGERVFVELDVEERDQYGRVLGYLYILDENGVWEFEGRTFTQINLELVIAGWAEPFTFPPNVAYAELYVEAARVARENNLGLWAMNQPQMVENPSVLIECILYNPQGRDEGAEQVTLYAIHETDVTDWYVADDAGNTWYFEGVLEADFLYDFTGYEEAIWNNSGDNARLFNADGQLVDSFDYVGGGVEACK